MSQRQLRALKSRVLTPTINSFAKRSEDNRVVCVLSLHLLQKSTLALFLISLAFDVATNPGPTMNNPGDVPNFPCSCGLKIAHLNLRSILGKMDDLKLLLTDKPFDIFTISETCLHATCSKSLLYRFMFEISAISRREIAQKSPLVYTCDFHREKIASSSATNICKCKRQTPPCSIETEFSRSRVSNN